MQWQTVLEAKSKGHLETQGTPPIDDGSAKPPPTATGDVAHSQKLLAHRKRDMTEHYVRSRVGERVRPLR
jgi:hypothetical protein